jgi:hypothetical protein
MFRAWMRSLSSSTFPILLATFTIVGGFLVGDCVWFVQHRRFNTIPCVASSNCVLAGKVPSSLSVAWFAGWQCRHAFQMHTSNRGSDQNSTEHSLFTCLTAAGPVLCSPNVLGFSICCAAGCLVSALVCIALYPNMLCTCHTHNGIAPRLNMSSTATRCSDSVDIVMGA